MTESIALLVASIIPIFVAFVVIYYAVRLAIRHEWERQRRREG